MDTDCLWWTWGCGSVHGLNLSGVHKSFNSIFNILASKLCNGFTNVYPILYDTYMHGYIFYMY